MSEAILSAPCLCLLGVLNEAEGTLTSIQGEVVCFLLEFTGQFRCSPWKEQKHKHTHIHQNHWHQAPLLKCDLSPSKLSRP